MTHWKHPITQGILESNAPCIFFYKRCHFYADASILGGFSTAQRVVQRDHARFGAVGLESQRAPSGRGDHGHGLGAAGGHQVPAQDREDPDRGGRRLRSARHHGLRAAPLRVAVGVRVRARPNIQ